MAIVTLNPIFISGCRRIGNVVLYRRYGKTCMRSYVKPRDPDTEKQRAVRLRFGDAVRTWQSLGDEEKNRFNRKARRLNMSGYNLFINEYIRGKALSQAEKAIKLNPDSFYPDSLQSRINTVSATQMPVYRETMPLIQVKNSS